MFTQCPRCDTVFRLSAETLRAAGGQVRCGRCGEVFNALARLAEDASAFRPGEASPGESSPGESSLEMEARADEILQSPAPPSAPAGPSEDEDLEAGDIDFAQLQVLEKFKPPPRPDSDAPPHPTPPPATRARPVEAAGKPPPRSPQAPLVPAAPPVRDAPEPGSSDGSLEFTLPPGELDRVFIDPTVARRSGSPAEPARPAPRAGERGEVSGPGSSGLEVAEHVRRDMLAGMTQRRSSDSAAPPGGTMHWAWGAAAAVLALLLLGQLLHDNREWLAIHAPLRGPLRGLYGAMGVSVQTPATLASYQLRQWGVTGDPNAVGTLRVRASILNTAPQLQPYPLLRVTLANRFGTRIGTRDFEPSEYLGKPTVRMMAPGERADAILDILDPGKEAEGFEIDVCLRGSDHRISCTADAATQTGASGTSAPQAKS